MKKIKKKVDIVLVLVIAVIIFQTVTIYHFYINVKILKKELNTTKNELQERINENYLLTQEQIDQLTSSLTTTQESFTKQISELKATTSADFSGIIEEVIESIVSIKTDAGQGSGFIIDEEGYIVTNAHVLSGAHYAKALTYKGDLKEVSLVGYNLDLDIALLKIKGNYDYLKFGNSSEVKVGEKVIAMGNPYGLSFTVTEGIVSAIHRKGLNNIEAYIQTDVPLNIGNSGGPLINKKGEVIGVNNFKVSGGESLGFALESNFAREAINNIALQAFNQTLV